MSGAGQPSLAQPLMNALRSDVDSAVRAAAAGTLGEYLEEPGVRQALEQAASSDIEPSVRQRAQAALR
jgi:HEAT repeat protein